jgi:hypothetical protein
MMYMYEVFVPEVGFERVGGLTSLGWIQAEYKNMPFVPNCYGILGMRQVVVYPLSMEVLSDKEE